MQQEVIMVWEGTLVWTDSHKSQLQCQMLSGQRESKKRKDCKKEKEAAVSG